jgi:transposase
MTPAEIRCVVGIAVAKQAHVGCALAAPHGVLRHKPSQIEATREGYALVLAWLATWRASAQPEAVLIGLEATGVLWEPLYDALIQAGYSVLVLNPRQTASWATSLGLRAKTDETDALTLARGVLAGLARASTLPSEDIQALRELTRARRDLIQARTAARQRLHDELVLVFPEFPQIMAQLPGVANLGSPRVLQTLSVSSSAQAVARAAPEAGAATLRAARAGRWGAAEADVLHRAAHGSAASTRAGAARALVVRTFAQQALHLQTQIAAELAAAIPALLEEDAQGQRLQQIPGSGPNGAATIRAERGEMTRFSSVDAVVASAGLDPRTHQSGAFVGQKHRSKRGPGALRHALYLAAFVAARCAPEWRVRYHRLLARGRAKKEAFNILARALLRVIYQLLRTADAYDPARLNQQPAPVAGCLSICTLFTSARIGRRRAPLAWWWARTVELSMLISQTTSPTASERVWTCARIRSHVPSRRQR